MDFLDFHLEDIATHNIPNLPLGAADSPTFLYDLAANKKTTTDPSVFYEQIYTDGSKDGKKKKKKNPTSAVLDGELYQFRLPDNASSFSAELKTLDLALSHIQQDAYWQYIIFTDSLSAVQALENERTDNPLIVTLLDKICTNAILSFVGSLAIW